MPTTTSTILFTDTVESTVLRTELGETAADRLFREHEHALHGVVTSHRGSVVKTAGDGIMASFESATDAVQAAVAVQQCMRARGLPGAEGAGWAGRGRRELGGRRLLRPAGRASRPACRARPSRARSWWSSLVRMLAGDRAGVQFRSMRPVVACSRACRSRWMRSRWNGRRSARRPAPTPSRSRCRRRSPWPHRCRSWAATTSGRWCRTRGQWCSRRCARPC